MIRDPTTRAYYILHQGLKSWGIETREDLRMQHYDPSRDEMSQTALCSAPVPLCYARTQETLLFTGREATSRRPAHPSWTRHPPQSEVYMLFEDERVLGYER
ncbi:hypothetical protein BST61_g4461 [Cercospora zeina]